jgi:hypothetical protein
MICAVSLQTLLKGDFWYFQYFIQYCFICCPSDSTVSEDAGIEPKKAVPLRHWLSDALSTQLDLIRIQLDLIHTQLDLIHTQTLFIVSHVGPN